MEEEKKAMVEEPLLENDDDKGGFRTLPFIIGNDAMQKIASYGLMANMTLYLMNEYHMEMTTASNLLFFWSSATNILPLVGAIVADSFLGRFYTIGLGSVICLIGLILLWSTTIIGQARPPPCDQSCIPPTIFQFAYLCTSLGLISIGAGGITSSSLAFGADQIDKGDFRKQSTVKQRYFGWYYAAYTFSTLIALTCIVYIQDNLGWGIGFGVLVVLMMCGVCSFFLASNFYVKRKSKENLVTGFSRVVVAAYRKRHLELSDDTDYACYRKNNSDLVLPSAKLRFLNKACIIQDPEKDLTGDRKATNPWTLCTVDDVEELKSLIRVVPLWSTGMIMFVNICQNSFPLLQASSMDRQITPNFTIPAASFSTFTLIAVIVWVALYDRVFLPLASRIKKRQVHVTTTTRMGIGIFISFLAMMTTATVEGIRRSLAVGQGYEDLPTAGHRMSAMWLVPQYCLSGFAEGANAIGQIEFYFSELPRSMSSVASTLIWVGMSLANLVASFIMNTVDYASRAGGKESWISSDINKGHYDYYYLVLAGLSLANMIYFLVCRRAYGPLKQERKICF